MQDMRDVTDMMTVDHGHPEPVEPLQIVYCRARVAILASPWSHWALAQSGSTPSARPIVQLGQSREWVNPVRHHRRQILRHRHRAECQCPRQEAALSCQDHPNRIALTIRAAAIRKTANAKRNRGRACTSGGVNCCSGGADTSTATRLCCAPPPRRSLANSRNLSPDRIGSVASCGRSAVACTRPGRREDRSFGQRDQTSRGATIGSVISTGLGMMPTRAWRCARPVRCSGTAD